MLKVKAVIFDLDGTITRPCLDFDLIRREIGDVQGPILEAIEAMSASRRRRAQDILHRYELEAAENSQLNPGAAELLEQLRDQDRALGLITRNRRDSVERVCRIHNLSFDGIITRDDGPAKPDPFPVQHACRLMQVDPHDAVVVGDYLFDLISAHRAGSVSVLLSTQKNFNDFEHEADYVIASLNELTGVIAALENGAADS